MSNKLYSRLCAIASLGLVILVTGCSSDVDPDKVKVDAPGYYTGPMEKKGGGGAALGGDEKKESAPGN